MMIRAFLHGLPAGHPLRDAGGLNDVVLRCRQFMSDVTHTTEITYLSPDHLRRLPSPLPTGTR